MNRSVFQKIGVTAIWGMAFSLVGCSSKVVKEDTKVNYVIQEVLPRVTQEVEATKIPSITPVPTKEVINDSEFVIEDYETILNNLGSVLHVEEAEVIDESVVSLINEMPAKSVVKIVTANAATLSACFYSQEITPTLYDRMLNKSYSEGCTTSINNLRYVRVLHFSFDGEIHIGELVVNQLIEKDILDIFKELFDARYPIEQMVLIDEFDGDDNLSMEANNTSSFNYRLVEGTTSLSKHAYGLAIDINPKYNPYVRTVNDEEVIVPENGKEYADRSLDCEYYIVRDDTIYQAFIKRGFTWGGDWVTSKDYQHFQKVFQ